MLEVQPLQESYYLRGIKRACAQLLLGQVDAFRDLRFLLVQQLEYFRVPVP